MSQKRSLVSKNLMASDVSAQPEKRISESVAPACDLLPGDVYVSWDGGASGNPQAGDEPQRPRQAESAESERKPRRRPAGSGFQRPEGFD